MLKTSSHIGRDKSFVDDLNKERGIVRMRVAFVPRSAEIQPLFWRFVNTQSQEKTTTTTYLHSYSTLLYLHSCWRAGWARLDWSHSLVWLSSVLGLASLPKGEGIEEGWLSSSVCLFVCLFFFFLCIHMRGSVLCIGRSTPTGLPWWSAVQCSAVLGLVCVCVFFFCVYSTWGV